MLPSFSLSIRHLHLPDRTDDINFTVICVFEEEVLRNEIV